MRRTVVVKRHRQRLMIHLYFNKEKTVLHYDCTEAMAMAYWYFRTFFSEPITRHNFDQSIIKIQSLHYDKMETP